MATRPNLSACNRANGRQDVRGDYGGYRILGDENIWLLHLSSGSPEGWVVPGRNPNGVYLYLEDVDGLAARVSDLIVGANPERKP